MKNLEQEIEKLHQRAKQMANAVPSFPLWLLAKACWNVIAHPERRMRIQLHSPYHITYLD